VEVVVAVPLQPFGRDAGLPPQAVDDLGHRARQLCPHVGDAEAEGVAHPDLDGHLVLFRQRHQFRHEGGDEPFDVGPRDVLEMAPRDDPLVEGRLDRIEIHPEGLFAGLVEFQEDVVVGAGGQDARFLQADLFDQFEVFLDGSDPARDLRVLVPERETLLDRLAVLPGIEKELAGPDQAARTRQPVHELVQLDDLPGRVRRAGLLAVAERRVGDPRLLGDERRHPLVGERDLRKQAVREDVAVQVRLRNVLEPVRLQVGVERLRVRVKM